MFTMLGRFRGVDHHGNRALFFFCLELCIRRTIYMPQVAAKHGTPYIRPEVAQIRLCVA
jgi:hypothetical protein